MVCIGVCEQRECIIWLICGIGIKGSLCLLRDGTHDASKGKLILVWRDKIFYLKIKLR